MRIFPLHTARTAQLCASYFALTLVLCARLLAQAPIERQPPQPPTAEAAPLPPAPPVEWEVFESASRDFLGTEVTVRATPSNARCILEEVTPGGLRCHQELRPLPFIPFGFPGRGFEIDRGSVKTVWRPDRGVSCLLGMGLGFGFGAGVRAANSTSDAYQASNIALAGMIFAAVGGYIGYHAPLIHHVMYRAR